MLTRIISSMRIVRSFADALKPRSLFPTRIRKGYGQR
jgi:hypothetical protein